MMTGPIDPNLIAESNSAREALLRTDYEHIAGQLQRRGIEVDAITARVQTLEIALPTWGSAQGARVSPVSPYRVSHGTSSRSSKTAPSSISSDARPPQSHRTFPGTGSRTSPVYAGGRANLDL
jgi:hypothetical protein